MLSGVLRLQNRDDPVSASQILLLFASVFTAAGSVIGVVASLKIRRVRFLLREGSTARGVVTRLEETWIAPASDASSTSRSVGTTVYYPVITWSTGDGRVASLMSGDSVYRRLPEAVSDQRARRCRGEMTALPCPRSGMSAQQVNVSHRV
ncbi:DUF3592 domain-containing protein [Streptomyces sp. NBC_01443]|uniref:DUF3592 domain-containing protein n=1 Tax=Streptomyces sp. NBC_01443 TaxID=2903868 RepID=UPI00338EA63E